MRTRHAQISSFCNQRLKKVQADAATHMGNTNNKKSQISALSCRISFGKKLFLLSISRKLLNALMYDGFCFFWHCVGVAKKMSEIFHSFSEYDDVRQILRIHSYALPSKLQCNVWNHATSTDSKWAIWFNSLFILKEYGAYLISCMQK